MLVKTIKHDYSDDLSPICESIAALKITFRLWSSHKICGHCSPERATSMHRRPQTKDVLLVFNIGKDWRIHCDNKQVPYRREVGNYVLIKQEYLCGCSVVTKYFYIASKICPNVTSFDFQLSYTVNAALFLHVYDKFYEGVIFDEIQNITIPQLSIIKTELAEDTLYKVKTDSAIGLSHVADLIRSKRSVFLSEIDKTRIDDIDYDQLTHTSNATIATIVIMIVLLCIIIAILIYFYIKFRHLNTYYKSIYKSMKKSKDEIDHIIDAEVDLSVTSANPPHIPLPQGIRPFLTRDMWDREPN